MSEVRLISFHYFFRTLILLGFSSYIVILTKTDALQYYIAPRMMIYVKIASVILYIIACFQGYMALRAYWGKPVACECEQPVSRSTLRNTVAYGLLVLPLLIGFLLPNTALSSAMVAAKGMNLSAAKSSIAKQNTDLVTDNGASTGVNASKQATAAAPSHSTVPPSNNSTATNPVPVSSTETPTIAKSDAELQKMFHADNEWDQDFSKIGMILYKKDTIVVKPEIYMEILSSIDLFKNNFIGKKNRTHRLRLPRTEHAKKPIRRRTLCCKLLFS